MAESRSNVRQRGLVLFGCKRSVTRLRLCFARNIVGVSAAEGEFSLSTSFGADRTSRRLHRRLRQILRETKRPYTDHGSGEGECGDQAQMGTNIRRRRSAPPRRVVYMSHVRRRVRALAGLLGRGSHAICNVAAVSKADHFGPV